MNKTQLYLDCDGLLADFKSGFTSVTGMDPDTFDSMYGSKAFWKAVYAADSFFENLPPMEQGRKLYNLVKDLRPIILTGTPRGDSSVIQKMRWRDKYYPGVPMVICPARDKRIYCQPGDILIDDLLKYQSLWQDAGGRFIHYVDDAEKAYNELVGDKQ